MNRRSMLKKLLAFSAVGLVACRRRGATPDPNEPSRTENPPPPPGPGQPRAAAVSQPVSSQKRDPQPDGR